MRYVIDPIGMAAFVFVIFLSAFIILILIVRAIKLIKLGLEVERTIAQQHAAAKKQAEERNAMALKFQEQMQKVVKHVTAVREMHPELKDTQINTIEFLITYFIEHKEWPTLEALMKKPVGLTKSALRSRLELLVRNGVIIGADDDTYWVEEVMKFEDGDKTESRGEDAEK